MTAWLTAAGAIRNDASVGETGIFVVSADMFRHISSGLLPQVPER